MLGDAFAFDIATDLNFAGDIRAVGDFLTDQIAYQQRVGFNEWDVTEGFTEDDLRRALTEIGNVYQPSADGRKTIRELRAAI